MKRALEGMHGQNQMLVELRADGIEVGIDSGARKLYVRALLECLRFEVPYKVCIPCAKNGVLGDSGPDLPVGNGVGVNLGQVRNVDGSSLWVSRREGWAVVGVPRARVLVLDGSKKESCPFGGCSDALFR